MADKTEESPQVQQPDQNQPAPVLDYRSPIAQRAEDRRLHPNPHVLSIVAIAIFSPLALLSALGVLVFLHIPVLAVTLALGASMYLLCAWMSITWYLRRPGKSEDHVR